MIIRELSKDKKRLMYGKLILNAWEEHILEGWYKINVTLDIYLLKMTIFSSWKRQFIEDSINMIKKCLLHTEKEFPMRKDLIELLAYVWWKDNIKFLIENHEDSITTEDLFDLIFNPKNSDEWIGFFWL